MENCWKLLVLTVCGILFPIGTIQAADVPHPQWIWAAGPRDSAQKVYLRKEFSISQPVVKAEFCGAADFTDAVLSLNGHPVGEIANYGSPLRVELARRLNDGPNVFAARCQSSDGPSAVALRLKLEFGDGTSQFVLSDPSWSISKRADKGWTKLKFQPETEWAKAVSYGRAADEMLPHPEVDTAINPLDDYTQWKQALGTEVGTDPSKFSLTEGFEIERLRSAHADEGFWVSIEFDPKGRLIVGREDRGLLRMTIPPQGTELQVESINETLLECRGLLYAHDSLYVSANNSKGLYRLRDTDGDDQFDEVKLLYQSGGGVGHGRNDLALGPDGKIYLIAGDAVDLPRNLHDRTSPFREHSQGQQTREGHVLRFDAEGKHGELVAAGLRNPYGIAFHPDGACFTYDADAEYDMGSPWYRPTRIVHLTAGSDYGWRGVTKSWPPYYPDHADNAPPILDIGKGSPTGVKFGTKSDFPKPYRESLFVSDWAYGRILSVRLTPRGAGFVGRAKTFLKGQPFNVTDLDFGPDGAMYAVTGGRKTQSALYRIRYVGPKPDDSKPTPQQIARDLRAEQSRKLRHQLESLQTAKPDQAIRIAWPHLDRADPWIRYAARTAIEHQPVSQWKQNALSETRTTAALTALMALARAPQAHAEDQILARLVSLPLADLTSSRQGMALQTYRLCLEKNPSISTEKKTAIARQLLPLFPCQSPRVNITLTQVLAQLEVPELVPKILNWLPQAPEQSARLHGLFLLRNAKRGWTPERRRDYFAALLTMREFRGGEGMPTFIRRIEADALLSLDDAERGKFEELLARKEAADPLPVQKRPFVRAWKIDDLAKDLTNSESGHDYERGKRIFREALCIRCHRVGFEGASVGPDLTSVSRRFSRRDILESILTPSKVVAEQYRLANVITTDGKTLTGQIIPSRDYRSPVLQLVTKPLEPYQVTEIPKSQIESFAISQTSVMPTDLLNTFTREDILELLAWLEAGGNSSHPSYSK